MDWHTFCNFDRNISISQSPLPVFWTKAEQRFTECGELTVSGIFLISALISYLYLFVQIVKRLRSPSLRHASLSRRETASICFKFFSSFGALTCALTDLIFVIVYEEESIRSTSTETKIPTPATLILIGTVIVALLFASFSWLSILCAYQRISWSTFKSSMIGWASVFFVTCLRFYDQLRRPPNADDPSVVWSPSTIVVLIGVCLQSIYLISVILIDFACKRRRRHRRRGGGGSSIEVGDDDDDEVGFLQFDRSLSTVQETEPEIFLGPGDDRSNFLSKLTFHWTNNLMRKGYRGQLRNVEELYSLPRRLNVHELEERFLAESRHRRNASSTNGRNFSFVRTLHACFGGEFFAIGILKFFADALSFAGPILLGYLVDFMSTPNAYWWIGYAYAGAMLAASFLSATFSIHFNYAINRIGLKVRSVVMTTVYEKFLNVPQVELGRFSSGEMMNFMSTDSERVVNFYRSFHDFWSLPLQIAAALFLLYREVGLAFLAGLAFALFLIPVNRWIAVKIGGLSTGMMAKKDSRVKLMTELLFGIRIVKFGAWEESFADRITTIRRDELKYLKGRKYLDALCVYMWACAPVVIAILTFATYVLLGHRLTASKVFTSIALFNILIFPLNAFPWVVNGVVEAWVSCKRLQRFFDLIEFDYDSYYSQDCGTDSDADVCMHEATFSWTPTPQSEVDRQQAGQETPSRFQSRDATLKNLTFSIKKGQLIGVIGPVGSGKSSLFAAILAEIRKHDDGGSVFVRQFERSGVAYVSQESWLQHGTVRQNILFGRPYQQEVYDAVVNACALTSDFKLMPKGDLSEVGEQGVTLSGGQRARIALARAVYQNKGVYLLDDPLSAVDSHVAKFLFTHCIRGLLYGKTVILATHHVDYLKSADLVLVVKDGAIEAMGKPEEILNGAGLLTGLAATNGKAEAGTVDDQADESEEPRTPSDAPPEAGEPVFVLEEERETGIVKGRVYANYLRAVGIFLAFSIFLSLLLMQASKNISDWWLSVWVSQTESNSTANHSSSPSIAGHFLVFDRYKYPYQLYVANKYASYEPPCDEISSLLGDESNNADDVNFYLKVYGIMIGSNTIFALFRAFLYAYGCICAAKTLQHNLFKRILKAPVRFFDTTPVGRLVNRFSSDIYSIDDSLPFQANRLVACLFGLAGTTITMCYGLPWFAICIVPMAVLYYCIQRYYRHTTCDLKRLASTSLSPIYSHFTDTLNGLQTIRAFRVTERFLEQNRALLTANQRAQFSALACTQWLAVRLQLMGVVMVGAIAIIAVLEHTFRSVDPGLVGLAISYALSITSLLSGLLQAFTETEKEMVAVERISEYIDKVPSEKWRGIAEPPPAWPTDGRIEFKDVRLRYAANLPLALNGFSLSIRSGEKVGIVGRTGAGKSSILQALFRTTELESGKIEIDDTDIGALDLGVLRSSLAIIPQTPFLFSGSVRDNLDVEGRFNDWRLQWAVEACHLVNVISRLGGLDGQIGERGAGLSLGEKQLFCLARALLANAKILCIDEATAHVDIETDEKIQRTIKTVLSSATVLTIAHRIRTVLEYDRILVMSEGRIVEEGPPKDLLEVPGSHFAALAHVHA